MPSQSSPRTLAGVEVKTRGVLKSVFGSVINSSSNASRTSFGIDGARDKHDAVTPDFLFDMPGVEPSKFIVGDATSFITYCKSNYPNDGVPIS
jgi:hypothetical protein